MSSSNTFDMTEVSKEELPEGFIDSFSFSDNEKTGKNICCFDVSENSDIIVSFTDNSVNVYNQTLEFEYGFTFRINGTARAFWHNGYPAVYLDKSDMLAVVEPKGEIIQAYSVENSVENSKNYREIIQKSEFQNGNYFYCLEFSSIFTKLFSPNYTCLVRKELNTDIEKTVYENHNVDLSLGISMTVIIAFIACVVKFGFINGIKKRRN